MQFAKSTFIRPGSNATYGTVAVALSFFVFAYSSLFGQVSILAYYGLWFPLVLIGYRSTLGNYQKQLWLFAFGVFACLSIFWSAAPSVTARAAIQYMTHIICALIAMRTIDIRTLTRGAIAGTGIVLLYSILFGYYAYDPLDSTYSFVGAFDSKNQLGFYASLGIYFAFAAVFILGERRIWMVGGGIAGLLSAYCLLASQSATSVLTTGLIVALAIGMRGILFLSPRQRKRLFVVLAITGLAVIVAGVNFGGVDLVLGAFGKDSTLTGRTYLWQQGIEAAAQHPLFGVGYQGYWVQGFSEPERLWDEFYIASRTGFHFHNTFIETTVETGLIGVSLLVAILLTGLVGHLKRFLTDIRNDESYVLVGIATLLLTRAFVEIDILNPYQIGSFLFYYTAGKLTMKTRAPKPVPLAPEDRMEFVPSMNWESRISR
ncbi:O-antigen ligase family protein [Rhizobium leucaenae]|uniref:Exopolysaccharide production protein ExoQ n=1 Tax=Rhizobium leucaenae TaxID=29450 RepID=A0A7W6ZR38_9HYPH|nr:O-antigen ligase [Rhizobium leucaenae]MBB4567189.1 exopolysaccharide production protein ExoQ [Rhizobium leucaenae]MBB6304607.1 exopolysaccharide production protein ExoQ [Rhizobium leucaenae]